MDTTPTPFEALEQAVLRAGGQSALARICKVSQTAVWKWLQSSKRLPSEHVFAVEAATGVPRYLLRPDIYPRDMPPAPRWLGVDQDAGPIVFPDSRTRNGNRLTFLDTPARSAAR
ncbi:transcriptional regulator [Novosphingobium rosa]|uniref:transcriptional regulator n=1 Tax=Novosphingobium rosa TaxID=76978 RepID=UPI0009FF6479|nr:YdaS family helix-turn-helix protein [Novosphingobium rosa]